MDIHRVIRGSICATAWLALAVTATTVIAQQEIPLWGDELPAFSKPGDVEEYEQPDCWGGVRCIHGVTQPTLTIYLPSGQPIDKAVLVAPGGGYDVVAIYHEGEQIAKYLAAQGITAAVLKYRLPDPATSATPWKVPLSDLRQAMLLMRTQQEELGFSAERIGVMGFSASGHLAAYASLHPAEDARLNPDFTLLIYPAVKITPVNLKWLEEKLYYRPMSDAELAEQTLLGHIDEHSPPTFLAHAMDDEICHYTESTLYAEALGEHGVEMELHLFSEGGHGFGPGRAGDGTDQWLPLAVNWLDRLD